MTGYNMRIMSFVISDIACLGREGALRIGGKTLNTTKLKVATRHRSDLLQSWRVEASAQGFHSLLLLEYSLQQVASRHQLNIMIYSSPRIAFDIYPTHSISDNVPKVSEYAWYLSTFRRISSISLFRSAEMSTTFTFSLLSYRSASSPTWRCWDTGVIEVESKLDLTTEDST